MKSQHNPSSCRRTASEVFSTFYASPFLAMSSDPPATASSSTLSLSTCSHAVTTAFIVVKQYPDACASSSGPSVTNIYVAKNPHPDTPMVPRHSTVLLDIHTLPSLLPGTHPASPESLACVPALAERAIHSRRCDAPFVPRKNVTLSPLSEPDYLQAT